LHAECCVTHTWSSARWTTNTEGLYKLKYKFHKVF